ncbi:MAG: multicopper oxidase domain-containing protein [Thiohalomonadales bacterium]
MINFYKKLTKRQSQNRIEMEQPVMNSTYLKVLPAAVVSALMLVSMNVSAAAFVQCPAGGVPTNAANLSGSTKKCMHLGAGDGYVTMADGKLQYMFGFSDLTSYSEADALIKGIRAAEFPAPTITVDEGDEFYLTLTNIGMADRPDLADPHTVHFHGFPNASSYFDGVPDVGVSVNMGASLTYYYNLVEPGTYMYHCHVEASEHMQMGMLGNLYVKPRQNKLPAGTLLGTYTHATGNQYVYNDGDGSTRYDVEFPMQMASFDSRFHDASMNVQPLPFANMFDNYAMFNGRGYPDTVNTADLVPPAENGNIPSQKISSLVTATVGQKILLRFSNLSVTNYYSVGVNGLTMKVVGIGARLLRGPTGADLTYDTNSITIGGGESTDVIINTAGVQPGTYMLYTTNLNYLSNGDEDFGGMMTEIVISP